MAPKRSAAADAGAASKKKAAASLPEVKPGWKQEKPSLIYFGDDLAGNERIAAFDFDGTLVDWKEPGSFSLEPDSWEWLTDKVPKKLKAIHKEGFKIVLISNQALIKSALTGKAATNAKAKFDSVLEAAGVPATVLIATQKDGNRKPETGMWDFFTENCNGGVKVDKSQSYYVGDAAGRKYDFSDSDKVFAESVGLSFKVPEDVFGEVNKPNRDMASCLRKLADEILKDGTDAKAGFKANALRKAANSIEGHREKLKSAKEAQKLPGVGKGTASLIDEFLETGEMGEREKAAKAAAEGQKSSPGKASPAKGKEAGKPAKAKENPGLAFL